LNKDSRSVYSNLRPACAIAAQNVDVPPQNTSPHYLFPKIVQRTQNPETRGDYSSRKLTTAEKVHTEINIDRTITQFATMLIIIIRSQQNLCLTLN